MGAILSVVKGISVQPSKFSPHMQLDPIPEDEDQGPLPADDIDDDSGEYLDSSIEGTTAAGPMTRQHGRASHDNAESVLMVC